MTPEERAIQTSESAPAEQERQDRQGEQVRPLTIEPGLDASGLGTPGAVSSEVPLPDVLDTPAVMTEGPLAGANESTPWGEEGDALKIGSTLAKETDTRPDTSALQEEEMRQSYLRSIPGILAEHAKLERERFQLEYDLDTLAGLYVSEHEGKLADNPRLKYLLKAPAEMRPMLVGVEYSQRCKQDPYEVIQGYIDRAPSEDEARRIEQQRDQCQRKEQAYKLVGNLFRTDCQRTQEKIEQLRAMEEQQRARFDSIDQKLQKGEQLTPEEQSYHASITEFTPAQYEKIRQIQAVLNETDGVPSFDQRLRMARIADGDRRVMEYPQQQIADRAYQDRGESWTAFTNSWRNTMRDLKERHYDDSLLKSKIGAFSSTEGLKRAAIEHVQTTEAAGSVLMDSLKSLGEGAKVFADYAMMPFIGRAEAESRIHHHNAQIRALGKHAQETFDTSPAGRDLQAALGAQDSPGISAFLGMSQQSIYGGVTRQESELYQSDGFFSRLYGLGRHIASFPAQLTGAAINYTVGLPTGMGHSYRMAQAEEMARALGESGDRISDTRYIPFTSKQAATRNAASSFLAENLGGYVGFRLMPNLGIAGKAIFSGGKTTLAQAARQAARQASIDAAHHPGMAIAKGMLQSYLAYDWALPAGEALLGEALQSIGNGRDNAHAFGDYLSYLENRPGEEYAAMALTFLGLSALHVGQNARQRGKAKEYADHYRASVQYRRGVDTFLREREAADQQRTERMRELCQKYFGEETTEKLFKGDIETAMDALVSEQVKNPTTFLKKLGKIGEDYAEAEALRAAVRSGAALHVLKRAGYTEAERMEGGKVRLKFQTVSESGKPETRHVDWDESELTAFLQARTLGHLTDAVLDLQTRIRGEQLRQTHGADNTLWFHLGDMPEALRLKLPTEELESGELSLGTLETISRYANEHINETFGQSRIPMSALTTLGERGKERIGGNSKLIIPTFQTRLDNGTMVGYYALGKISERDILHELLERGVRQALDQDTANLPQILAALSEIQERIPVRNGGQGVRLLPDKPLGKMGHLEAVEGLAKLCELEMVASGGHYGLSPRAQSAVQFALRSLGGTDLIAKLGQAARGIIEQQRKEGVDGYRQIEAALQRAGMDLGARYREIEEQGRAQALEAVRTVLGKEETTETPAASEPNVPLTREAFAEATAQDAESETIRHEIPADETLIGQSIPAEARLTLPFIHPETGEIQPESGETVIGGPSAPAGSPNKGRGLVGGKYVETGRGSVRGAMAVGDIKHPTPMTPELVLQAARHNLGKNCITVYRFKSGKMVAVDGYDLLHQAQGGKYVEVEVIDVEGSSGRARLNAAHRDYLMSIGGLDKSSVKAHAKARELNRSEAESQGLVPRDRNGQVEPAARAAWEEMGPTFFARERSRSADYSSDAERRYVRAIDRFAVQSARGIHDLLCGENHYVVTESQLREQYAKDHPGEKYDKEKAVHDIRIRVAEALHLLRGHIRGLRESIRELHAEEIVHEETTPWLEALEAWNLGKEARQQPPGLPRETYELLNDASKSEHLRAQTLAQVVANYASDCLKHALERDRAALTRAQMTRLEKLSSHMDPATQDAKSPQTRQGRTTLEAWQTYQEARRIMNLSRAELDRELEAAQNQYDAAVQPGGNAATARAAQRQLYLLNGYGDLMNRNLSDIIDAVDMLVGELHEGRDSMNAKQGQYDAFVQWMRERIARAAQAKTRGKKIDNTGAGEQRQAKTSHHLMRYMRSLYNMFQRLEKHSAGAGKEFLRDWMDQLSEGERLAMYDRVATQRAFKKACAERGVSFKDINAWNKIRQSGIRIEYGYKTVQPPRAYRYTAEQLEALRDPRQREAERAAAGQGYYPSEAAFEQAYQQLAHDASQGRYREDYEMREPAQRDYNQGTENWELSQSQALYVLLMADQRGGREHLRKHGIDDKVLEQLEDYIDPRLKDLGKWMRTYLNGNGLKEIYEARTGCPFHFEENYFPFRFKLPKAETDARSGMQETPVNTGYANYSFLFRRVPHEWRPDTTSSAFNVFFETMESVRNYKYKSPYCEIVHDTLRAQDTMNYFAKLVGEDDAALILQDVQHFAGNYAPIPESAKGRFGLGWFWNKARSISYLLGAPSTLVRNLTSWLNVYSDQYFRGLQGKLHMLTFLMRGFGESALQGASYISQYGPFRFFRGLQELQQNSCPMTLLGMLQHPLMQARLAPPLAARVAQMRPGTSYTFLTALKDACLSAGVNLPDVLGNAVTHAFLYNHVWREARENGLTESEARAEAEARLTQNLLRGTQPVSAAGKASAVLGMPSPDIMSDMFCKSELVNKVCQAFSLMRQVREGNPGMSGYLKQLGEFYCYMLPFATAEQAVSSAFTYYASGIDKKSARKQDDFFMNNLFFAASLMPTLNLHWATSALLIVANEFLAPKEWQLATKATAGQVADVQQWTDTVQDARYLFKHPELTPETWWSASEILRVLSVGAELFADRNVYARYGADLIQLVNGVFNAGRPVARRNKKKRKRS